jgi:hypothetical protein
MSGPAVAMTRGGPGTVFPSFEASSMPARLLPLEAIPALAEKIDSPQMLKVLRYLDQNDFIHNSHSLDPETAKILERLTALELVDAGYSAGRVFQWVATQNGKRVLDHFSGSWRPAKNESAATSQDEDRTYWVP